MVWNWAHIHLILNHIPIIGIPIVAILFLVALIKNDRSINLSAHWLLIGISVMSIVVFLTGIGAQEDLEKIGISHAIISPHHVWTLWTSGALVAQGLWSAYLVFRNQKGSADIERRPFLVISLIACLVTSSLLAVTSLQGAKIRHSEIRPKNWEAEQTHQHEH